MALRRVFVEWIRDGGAGVSGARAHHLARVARLRPGETVEISDQHHLFLAKATSISGRRVDFEIVEPLPVPAQPFPIILQTAIFQFARFEWIVEKASELGVRSIVPVCAALSERGLIKAARNRRSRWQKIAEEGAQQARRLTAPSVEEPVAFEEVLGAASGPLRFFLDTGSTPLKDFLEPAHKRGAGDHPAYLLVGPEGGWTDGERQQAQAAGYRSAALNTGVLRAETAALTAVAIASHLLGRRPEPEMPGSSEAAGL